MAQEGSVAHPERDGAKNEVGEATDTLVDVHSDPDGASDGDGDFPMTVMDKTSNQPVIEHHGNQAELELR